MPSSTIRHFSYDHQSATLVIAFVTGTLYAYHKVPLDIFNMLKVTGSKASYFNRYIKDQFQFSKLKD